MTDPLSDWDFDAVAAPPAPIVPIPAAATAKAVRGRRVLIGLPGLGWRGDMRADAPVVQGSRTYVPVLPEHEWYRAEAEQIEAFAPMVPIERVWVETVGSSTADAPGRHDLVSRLVSLDAPPPRTPVALRDVPIATGRRVVKVPGAADKAGRDQRDLRAVTEAYSNDDGDICIRVSAELDWYRWAWTGRTPRTLEVPIHLLWLE